MALHRYAFPSSVSKCQFVHSSLPESQREWRSERLGSAFYAGYATSHLCCFQWKERHHHIAWIPFRLVYVDIILHLMSLLCLYCVWTYGQWPCVQSGQLQTTVLLIDFVQSGWCKLLSWIWDVRSASLAGGLLLHVKLFCLTLNVKLIVIIWAFQRNWLCCSAVKIHENCICLTVDISAIIV